MASVLTVGLMARNTRVVGWPVSSMGKVYTYLLKESHVAAPGLMARENSGMVM